MNTNKTPNPDKTKASPLPFDGCKACAEAPCAGALKCNCTCHDDADDYDDEEGR